MEFQYRICLWLFHKPISNACICIGTKIIVHVFESKKWRERKDLFVFKWCPIFTVFKIISKSKDYRSFLLIDFLEGLWLLLLGVARIAWLSFIGTNCIGHSISLPPVLHNAHHTSWQGLCHTFTCSHQQMKCAGLSSPAKVKLRHLIF